MPLRIWHIVLAAVALVFLILIPATRSAGARVGDENLLSATYRVAKDSSVGDLLRMFFVSYDTEMYDYIAYMHDRMGSSMPWGNGRGTLLEFVTRPLPASMGPKGFSDVLLSALFGGQGCGQSACPVASLPGVAYFDFGYTGVAILLFAFGLACARVSARLSGTLQPNVSTLVAVVFASYALVMVRTNTVIATWWFIYTLVILVALMTLLRALPSGSRFTTARKTLGSTNDYAPSRRNNQS